VYFQVAMEAVTVAVVLCDNIKNNAENHAVVVVRRVVAVAPVVAAAVGVVARLVVRPVVAHQLVARRIVLATQLSRKIAGHWQSA